MQPIKYKDGREPWLPPEIDKLSQYIQENLPATCIAELLERSEGSVRSYCSRNKILVPHQEKTR